ncbi:hypothetical protein SDJN02_04112, partial [Cucurbita argyrosperma subsp. argyrosperma]
MEWKAESLALCLLGLELPSGVLIDPSLYSYQKFIWCWDKQDLIPSVLMGDLCGSSAMADLKQFGISLNCIRAAFNGTEQLDAIACSMLGSPKEHARILGGYQRNMHRYSGDYYET